MVPFIWEGRFLIDQIIKCWVTKRVDRRRRKQDFQSTIKMKHLFFSKTKPWIPTFSQLYLYWWCQVKSPTIYLSTSRSIIRASHSLWVSPKLLTSNFLIKQCGNSPFKRAFVKHVAFLLYIHIHSKQSFSWTCGIHIVELWILSQS